MDEITDRLTRLDTATTLWKEANRTDELLVATTVQLDHPTLHRHGVGTYRDAMPEAASTVLHVVKTKRGYRALIDGSLPETAFYGADPPRGVAGREVQTIVAHRGLQVDPEQLDNMCLSPCAVAVTVDDGLLSPQRCTVRVWQQYSGDDGRTVLGPRRLCGDTDIEPLKMTSHLVDAVHVPFPIARSRKRRVVIFDHRKVFRDQLRRLGAQFKEVTGGADFQSSIKAALESILTGKDPAVRYLMTKLSNVLKTIPGFLLLSSGDGLSSSGGSWMDRAWSWWSGDDPNGYAVLVRIYQAAGYGLIALPAMLGAMSGSSLYQVLGTAATGGLQTFAFSKATTDEEKRNQALVGAVLAAFNGMVKVMSEKPLPEPDRIHLTLDELASTLEALGALTSLSDAQVSPLTADAAFRRETAVWAWLTMPPTKEGFLRLRYKPSTMCDTSELLDANGVVPHTTASVKTTIEIVIDDNEECDRDPRFEFAFQDDDDERLLALADQGILGSIDRLQRAIQRFEDRLVSAIRDKELAWVPIPGVVGQVVAQDRFVQPAAYWWDYFTYGPYATYLCESLSLQPKSYQERGLKELGFNRLGMLSIVHDNLPKKLLEPFVNRNGPGQRMRAIVQDAVDRRMPKTIRPQTAAWVRTFPQKTKSLSVFFPNVVTLNFDEFDVQSLDSIVREASVIKDAVTETTRSFRRSIEILRRVLDENERGSTNRLVLRCAHRDLSTLAASDRTRLRLVLPIESYGLVLQLPADVRNRNRVVDQDTARRMKLLSSRLAQTTLRRVPSLSKILDDEDGFTSLAIFAELWTDEVVTRFRQDDSRGKQTYFVMKAASRGATERAVALADLVLDTTQQRHHGFFAQDDPILAATRAGQDARRFARRLWLRPNATPEEVAGARALATVVKSTVVLLGAKAETVAIPSEPLQSLVMDGVEGGHTGHYAYERALLCAAGATDANTSTRVARALCAAYPSLLFEGRVHPALKLPVPGPAVPAPQPRLAPVVVPAEAQRVASELLVRMSKLRLDFPELQLLELENDVDGLANRMGRMHVTTVDAPGARSNFVGLRANLARFHVPFGYGDPPPSLGKQPVSAIMFGSVPVSVDAVRVALRDAAVCLDNAEALRRGLVPPPLSRVATRRIVLRTADSCRRGNESYVSEVPTIITARNDPQAQQPWKTVKIATPDPVVEYQFTASTHAAADAFYVATPRTPPPATVFLAYPNPSALLRSYRQELDSLKDAAVVSQLAWNAERILQCHLAAVAQAGTFVDAADCYLPRGPDPRVPPGPGALFFRRQREAILLRMATYGRAALRHLKQIVAAVLDVQNISARMTPVYGLLPRNEDIDYTNAPADAGGLSNVSAEQMGPLVAEAVVPTGVAVDEFAVGTSNERLIQSIRDTDRASVSDADITGLFRRLPDVWPLFQLALINDKRWRDGFNEMRDIEKIQDSEFGVKMAEVLDDYLDESETGTLLQDIVNQVAPLELRERQLQDLAARSLGRASRARSQSVATGAQREQRTRLVMAYVLGTAMADDLVGPLSARIASFDWQPTISQSVRNDDRIAMLDALERLHNLTNGGASQHLRLSEVCAIMHIACA
tara:strand:+ start:1658 stop:6424 length:4767 start_codon:yes stop_codon:yes gene_type:complete